MGSLPAPVSLCGTDRICSTDRLFTKDIIEIKDIGREEPSPTPSLDRKNRPLCPQVTIPKKIRSALGINTGDRVTFIVEDGNVRIVNSAVYALQRFQDQMKGEAWDAGFLTEEDVAEWITKSRREEAAE